MRFLKTLTFLTLATALVFAAPAWAQQNPFTQEQVVSMVRDGFGDESGAKLIEQRGIDFTPAKELIQTLKAAGASETFLNALRSAKPPEPTSPKKPINQVQVFALLAGGVPDHRVTMLVQERGIDFEPTDDYLQEVNLAGGEDELISALKSAKVKKPATVDPAAQARQAEVRRHVARVPELYRSKRYADAETELRAAVRLAPDDAALRHLLAVALQNTGALDGAIAEDREALRLNANLEEAHLTLGVALGRKGDVDGEIAEERDATRLNPNDDLAHNNLGNALGTKHGWDGEIIEEREALRLNPNNAMAHANLGIALGAKGDWDGKIPEEREALKLSPNIELAHIALGTALGARGDSDGEIAEERDALRSNPNNELAHFSLGVALGAKGDLGGAVAEEREAIRLNTNNEGAHYYLAVGLEKKGDRRGAVEEYRTAYMLDPKDATYKQNYERLLKQVNQ